MIGLENPNSLLVVDAGSLQIEKTVQLKLGAPYEVAQSTGKRTSKLYVFQVGSNRRGKHTLIDLETGDEQTLSRNDEHDPEPYAYCYFSGGNRIYSDSLGINRRPWPPLTPPVFVTPWKEVYVSGRSIVSGDSQFDLTFSPWVFLEQAWCAGFDNRDLVVGSALGTGEFARTQLPDAWYPEPPKRVNAPVPVGGYLRAPLLRFLHADPQRKLLIVGNSQQLGIVSWKNWNLPVQPILQLQEPPPPEAMVGDEYKYAPQCVSGDPQLVLIAGPNGMTLVDQTLRWTLRWDQVGEATVRLKVKVDQLAHWETWSILVKQRQLNTSFVVTNGNLSEDGTLAVLWGKVVNESTFQLGVYDMKTGQKVVSVDREFPVMDAVITRQAVVITENRPNADSLGRMPLVKLSIDQLAENANGFSTPGTMIAKGDNELFIVGHSENARESDRRLVDISRVNLNDLSEDAEAATQEPVNRVNEGWIYGGCFWPNGSDKPSMLLPQRVSHAEANRLMAFSARSFLSKMRVARRRG